MHRQQKMEGFATAYPVVFFDGDQKYDKGNIGLHSLIYYKKFQTIIAQITGIPPNQQSTVFVCRRSLKSMSEKRQRLPINENTNFAIILNQHNPNREKDCYFLVSVKKSKRDRKGRGKRNAEAVEAGREDYDEGSNGGEISSLSDEWNGYQEKNKKGGAAILRGKPEKTILRRETTPVMNTRFSLGTVPLNRSMDMRFMSGGDYGGFMDQGRWFSDESGLMGRPRNLPEYYPRGLFVPESMMGLYNNGEFSPLDLNSLPPTHFPSRINTAAQMQSQFQMNVFGNETGDVFQGPSGHGHMEANNSSSVYSSSVVSTTMTNSTSICEKCCLSKERPVPFHFCVNDAVTLGFNGPSPAGPIERPVRATA